MYSKICPTFTQSLHNFTSKWIPVSQCLFSLSIVAGPRVHPVPELLGRDLHDGRLPPPPPHLLQPQDDRQDQGLHLGKVQVKKQIILLMLNGTCYIKVRML